MTQQGKNGGPRLIREHGINTDSSQTRPNDTLQLNKQRGLEPKWPRVTLREAGPLGTGPFHTFLEAVTSDTVFGC